MPDAIWTLAVVLVLDAEMKLRAEVGFYPSNEVCRRMEDLAVRHQQWCQCETAKWREWNANNPIGYRNSMDWERDAEPLASFWRSIETATNPTMSFYVRVSALESARNHAERACGDRHAIPPPVPVWWFDSR